jgi:signal transduction histidine kinase
MEEPKITVACNQEEDRVQVAVKDNGYGIPEEHQSKLFDMFFRGVQGGKGTGLGLYIVKESAMKLNGDISLESQPGKGSTFIVDIPNFTQNGH